MAKTVNRRLFIKRSLAASAGLSLAAGHNEHVLSAKSTAQGTDEQTPSLQKSTDIDMPMGRIKHINISRLICGGNLIIGSAHDRDLIYVASLMRHYFTDKKIIETWQICEECGINTMIGPVNSPYAFGEDPTIRVYNRYRNEWGGKIQWIAQTYPKTYDLYGSIQTAIDNGAVGAFIHGGIGDNWVRNKRVDLLAKAVDFIKKNGLIAGCACHSLEVPMALEKACVNVDFYMKTLHSGDYWSATPKPERPKRGLPPHDNMWCSRPEETIGFMKNVRKPWIAFKVLAAGAIRPQKGFRFAFENGADFANVGMFDFQVREDALITRDIIAEIKRKGRARTWMA
ncbi:MAG: hypothetical protein H8D56_17255 [Planctomycetes bacterium]|nr:hypothetical protein [Planctomycetota bacterium]MBL7143459.1 hypothetical protein [Phycisphaerae bacterium]